MRPLRLALLGCGNWGEKLARNVAALPSLRLAVACDIDPARAGDVGGRHGAERIESDADAALASGGIDAAIVATPARTHEALVRRALDAGLHVLCEKPLALSAARGAELLARAGKAGTSLATDHTELHSGPFRALAACLARGALGEMRSASLVHATDRPGPADVDAVWDLAPHDFAVLDALGAGELAALDATAAGPQSAILAVRFAGGLSAEIRLARDAPERRRALELRGTRGTAAVEGFRPGHVVRLRAADGGAWSDLGAGDGVEPLRRLLEDFARRVREGSAAGEAEAELRILRAVEAASRAVQSRAAVERTGPYGAICASNS